MRERVKRERGERGEREARGRGEVRGERKDRGGRGGRTNGFTVNEGAHGHHHLACRLLGYAEHLLLLHPRHRRRLVDQFVQLGARQLRLGAVLLEVHVQLPAGDGVSTAVVVVVVGGGGETAQGGGTAFVCNRVEA